MRWSVNLCSGNYYCHYVDTWLGHVYAIMLNTTLMLYLWKMNYNELLYLPYTCHTDQVQLLPTNGVGQIVLECLLGKFLGDSPPKWWGYINDCCIPLLLSLLYYKILKCFCTLAWTFLTKLPLGGMKARCSPRLEGQTTYCVLARQLWGDSTGARGIGIAAEIAAKNAVSVNVENVSEASEKTNLEKSDSLCPSRSFAKH